MRLEREDRATIAALRDLAYAGDRRRSTVRRILDRHADRCDDSRRASRYYLLARDVDARRHTATLAAGLLREWPREVTAKIAAEEYVAAVDYYLEGVRDVYITGDESYFSWSQCDSCGSGLGGDRIDAIGTTPDGDIELSLCHDCAVYHGNGELPEDWFPA